MKQLLLVLALLYSGSVFGLDKCWSGSYFDPERSGAGVDLQISDDVIVLYKFDFSGGFPEWFVGSGENVEDSENTYVLIATQATQLENGDLFSKNIGEWILTVDPETDDLRLEWDFKYDLSRLTDPGVAIPWCLHTGCFGDLSYVPLFRPTSCN